MPRKTLNHADHVESAESAGLRYVTNETNGIRREKSGKRFVYRNAAGQIIRDRQILSRINSLVIPRAWSEVWICPAANGHLQATGRDDRGRKQHIYHPRWREARDETKYNRLLEFARTLTRIRRHVQKDLSRRGLVREKVLATIVRLLEASCIRIGNDEYARTNKSYGLTTLQDRHADINGATIRFEFRGKSGKAHIVDVHNARLAKIVRACQDLPGQELFQFLDEAGKRHDVQSGDVNGYLHEISGQDFTAKDFRTWAGTVFAARALHELGAAKTQTEAKKKISEAIKSVAQSLGNTAAVCRKCYVHPAVLDSYAEGELHQALTMTVASKGLGGLRAAEIAVLNLLKRRSAKPREPIAKTLERSLRRLKTHPGRNISHSKIFTADRECGKNDSRNWSNRN